MGDASDFIQDEEFMDQDIPIKNESDDTVPKTEVDEIPLASTSTAPVPPEPEPAPPPPAEPTFSSLMGLSGEFQYGAYMASLGTRLKTILTNIKPSADPTTRLMALQDLSEILSMSTEDNLNGYFAMDEFVRVLVGIMGGGRKEDEEGDGSDDEGEHAEPVDAESSPEGQPPTENATEETPAPPESITEAPAIANTTDEVTPAEGTTKVAPAEGTVPSPAAIGDAQVQDVTDAVAQAPDAAVDAVPQIPSVPVAQASDAIVEDVPVTEQAVTLEPAIPEPPNAMALVPPILEPLNAMVLEPPIPPAPIHLDMAEMDEDAALAAALAMSAGDAGFDLGTMGMDSGLGMGGEENLEEQLLACRCLANLMEAMPGSAHTLVYHGAVPVLCSKLLQITFIDLAEQTISVSGFLKPCC